MFGKRIDGPGGRRRAQREPVLLAAAAHSLEESRSVLIEDVGPTGARLRSPQFRPAANQLLIRAGATEVLASVVWSRGDECGILFDEPLDTETLASLKKDAAWAVVVGAG